MLEDPFKTFISPFLQKFSLFSTFCKEKDVKMPQKLNFDEHLFSGLNTQHKAGFFKNGIIPETDTKRRTRPIYLKRKLNGFFES